MLTRTGYTIFGAALALLTAGLAAGNFYYATLALVPLGALVAGLLEDAPHKVRASVTLSKANPRAGEEVLAEVDYEADAGAGPIEIAVELPDPFELVNGSNVHVAVKRPREPLKGRWTFTFRASVRGEHRFGPVHVEAVHPAGLRAPATGEAAPATTLDVRPREASVRRVRGLSGHARDLFPENDLSRTGIRTTDFRELREYTPGDPTKFINWKATARRASAVIAGTAPPLVNEHEREGKKTVWLFLDAAPYMSVGTTAENSFDQAIAAALGVATFYLERGYRLGAYVYNHHGRTDGEVFLHPETGRRQVLKLTRALTHLKPGPAADEGLFAAVDRAKAFLVRDRPLVIIVTRVGKADERAFAALRRLRALAGRRRRRLPILLVSPVVASAIPATGPAADYGRDLVALLRRREKPLADRARRLGARVIEWDPKEARLATVLLKGARDR